MFEETGSLVECSVCETEFDPDAAGGWCTNPDCGEWKYEGEEPTEGSREQDPLAESDGPEESETEFSSAETAGEPDTEQPVDGDASDPLASAEDATGVDEGEDDTSAEEVEGETPAEEVEEETPAEKIEDETPVDQGGDPSPDDEGDGHAHVDEEPPGTDDEEASGATETDEEPAETIDCPGCGETLETDVNFCPSCGEDVSAVEPESTVELTTCPACEESVDPGDSFCASCGENLEAHREQRELTACPDCGADIDADDQFCAACGEDLEAHRQTPPAEEEPEASDDQSTPDSLLLETRGREIAVSDGDIVGRELRKIVTETGGDQNDAVRIHREHIRFVREDGEFYLVDLGENPTDVNGHSLSKGDRESIAPGDTITLSDIVTLAVARP